MDWAKNFWREFPPMVDEGSQQAAPGFAVDA
jgi:hypothetical protein